MQTYSSKHSSPKATYLGLAVFICLFLVANISYGFTIPSQCPPPVSPEMAPLIDIPTDDWLDEGWYDPVEGYLPENYPGMSWDSFYTDGSSAELVDSKLIAHGSTGTGSLPMLQVAWHRGADELIRPDGLFIIQVQCRITYTPDGIDTQDQTLVTVWGSAGDRDCPFSLRYQDGQRVVVLGQVDYCDDPDYVLDYDWSQDTVYTLLVSKGDMLYLEVGPGYWMERSYWEMPESGEEPEMVGFATGKVDAEYSYVHYCIGMNVYYGEVVDLRPTLPPLEGDHGRMMAEIGNFLPDPVIPGEEANLHISLDALSMPALPSGQFDFAVDTTVDIRTFDPVMTIVVETPLIGLGLHEYDIPWDGTNDLGQPLEPGVYIYKTTVDFAREKTDGDQIKYFDMVESPWRLVIIGPPPGP